MKKIVLYSTGCPQCCVLKSLMDKRGIEYETIDDVDLMLELGFTSVPMLEIDGVVMKYIDAFKWINEQNEGKQED